MTRCSPFQQQQHHPNPSLSSLVRQTADSSRLCAFGGGGGGFGNFSPNPPKIQTKKDVLQRLQMIVTGTLRQFTSGFMSGYVLGSIWGLIRGPSLTVANRGVAWGLDFGILSALFSGTNSVTEFFLALSPKEAETESNDDKTSTNRRQQKAALWSVVIRNMILAIYFGRNGGIVKMAQLSVLYGGLTYFFVGNKIKRDAKQMAMFGGSGNPGMMGGGGQPSADTMQQLFQQMMAMQGQTTTTPKQTPRPPGPSSTKSKASSSSSPLFNDKNKSKKDNAVDVEFEKVDTDKDGDAKQ